MSIRPTSTSIFARAQKVMPGGVSSPARACSALGITPLIAERGMGDTVWDSDGNGYIDYCGSWGALILGHAHPAVVAAAQEYVARGSTFGMVTPLEPLLAQAVVDALPSVEQVRFVSTGTEATMTAIRLARAVTSRSAVVKFEGHYHGHSDGLLVKRGVGVRAAATSRGIPEEIVGLTVCAHFNDLEGTRSFLRSRSDIAAVLVEPVACNMGVVPPMPGFLAMLREETARQGSMLIFDEVVTGFRVGRGGAQGLYGIMPDLTCLGKILGGGFPVAAIAGRAEWMEHLAPMGSVYQAGTFSGNPVGMAAGLCTLRNIERPEFFAQLEESAKRLAEPLAEYLAHSAMPMRLERVGSILSLSFTQDRGTAIGDMFRRFFLYLFERGIYIPPSPYEAWFLSSAHTCEHIDETAKIMIEALSEVRKKG